MQHRPRILVFSGHTIGEESDNVALETPDGAFDMVAAADPDIFIALLTSLARPGARPHLSPFTLPLPLTLTPSPNPNPNPNPDPDPNPNPGATSAVQLQRLERHLNEQQAVALDPNPNPNPDPNPNRNRNPTPTPTPTPNPNQAVALEMPHCARGWMQRAAEERALAARPPGMLPATRTALVVD